ncbi:MAG: glycosyltransferase family 4 protein [Pseudomonadota bacterium]
MTHTAIRHAILYYGGFTSRSGGAFTHTTTLSQGLRARGWTVQTVTLDRLPLLLRYIPHLVAAVMNKIYPPLGFYYKGRLISLLYKYFIQRRPGDLLVFEDVYLSWNSEHPSISVLHAVWSDNLQSFRFTAAQVARLKRKEVALINAISHPVVTVSEPYRDFLQQSHFADVGSLNLEVVELGLDIENLPKPRARPIPDNGRSLIYVGALEARKNVAFMLDVFRHIAAIDPAATLTIVGRGPDREGLEKYVTRQGLNVTFLGWLAHDQVLEELTRHDLYIHTALKESFSFALLEAKLAGLTTCALARLEVPAEFIDLGFAELDADDWCSKILAVTKRPDLTNFPEYSIDRMTDRTLALVSDDAGATAVNTIR